MPAFLGADVGRSLDDRCLSGLNRCDYNVLSLGPSEGRILVPTDETFRSGFLDPEDRIPTQNVGADQIFDHVDKCGMTHDLVDLAEWQIDP